MPINCYTLDPVADVRWDRFVESHSRGSVFHTSAWLKTLQSTYGYRPVVFTTASPREELNDGVVFCEVNSWITGQRLVSLPFSDHCEPLCNSIEGLTTITQQLQAALGGNHWRYIEVRPVTNLFARSNESVGSKFIPTSSFSLHILDLRADIDSLFNSFDRDSIQRRIQRAEQARLSEKCGTTAELLTDFYNLFVVTRRRQQLPPIPPNWFRNLINNQAGSPEIRVAYSHDGTPISAILTLRFRDIVYYKYGCSDYSFNKFGATPWLLWRAIIAAKSNGASRFDFGRTEEGNPGLLAFKNHWVSQPKAIMYWNYPVASLVGAPSGWKVKAAKKVFRHMPEKLLSVTGQLVYRHIG